MTNDEIEQKLNKIMEKLNTVLHDQELLTMSGVEKYEDGIKIVTHRLPSGNKGVLYLHRAIIESALDGKKFGECKKHE